MIMKTLWGTSLQWVYCVFGVENDDDLCTRMSNIALIFTALTALYCEFVPVPYGRYLTDSIGLTINAKLGWILQECMSFFFPLIVMSLTPSSGLQNFANIIPLFLFLTHYFHRTFIFPLYISGKAKPLPLLTVSSAIVFTSYNGFLQGMSLLNGVLVDDSIYGFLGTIIFITGMVINILHDRMLISLRKETNTTPAELNTENESDSPRHRYKIPRGGLFEYVSAANYLGEIIEWWGYALITRKYPQVVFALFTSLFLGIRAIHHHKFYKEMFGSEYPSTRTAVIPFIL